MISSRPEHTQRLMPRLAYVDAPAAIAFLRDAFGFEETSRFAPRGRLVYSEMALDGETLFAVTSEAEDAANGAVSRATGIDLFCSVDDVDRHYERAKGAGARIVSEPADKFWGDRSYSARDREGYQWTFRKIVKAVALPDSKPT